ncbi:hypothetical protein EYF80_057443 [Liparis tanakae]|uniref:Uncharacterized protein n=1 Tax=Liparis tanakae TaxID=230148 RepID=A0A4Z2EUC2_9TELE|nr:hypothetical protein EYF80_057443 [Liparis tanakae]
MRPPKERERGCFLLAAGAPWWWCSIGGVAEVVSLTSCTPDKENKVKAAGRRGEETDLPDELLLLGGVGHVVVDVSEELLQGLLRVLLSRGPVLLRRRRTLQGQRGPPGRGAARRQQLQSWRSVERLLLKLLPLGGSEEIGIESRLEPAGHTSSLRAQWTIPRDHETTTAGVILTLKSFWECLMRNAMLPFSFFRLSFRSVAVI